MSADKATGRSAIARSSCCAHAKWDRIYSFEQLGGLHAGLERSHVVAAYKDAAPAHARIGAHRAAAVSAFPSIAQATARPGDATAAKTLLQKGLAFYQGKTLSWFVGGSIGGGDQVFALALAPAMGQYLHATVAVTAIPAGGGVAGADQANAAKSDGLTIGLIDRRRVDDGRAVGLPKLNRRRGFAGAVLPPSPREAQRT